MADARDFVPVDADIDIEAVFGINDVENLAKNDDELTDKVRMSVHDYDIRFTGQRQEWAIEESGLWSQMDAAFRSFVNDSSVQNNKRVGAGEPAVWERAKVGTTQFYRQVTQMAANGYAVQTSKEVPFKYSAINDGTIGDTDENAQDRADRLNLLAKWTMKKDRFNLKSIDFWTQIKKYGNVPVMVEWVRKSGKRVIRIPVLSKEDGSIERYDYETIETIVENRPSLTLLPIESVKADVLIGNIQDQECVIVSSIVGMKDLVGGIRDGLYREDLIEDLTRTHQWDGWSGFENAEEKKRNRDLNTRPSAIRTGMYLKREIFVNLPIDEDGKWDELKNVPKRYRVTMFGNLSNNSLVARIERNQEPDDTIPIEMIHANPDDADILYHISNFEVIRPNLAVETTLIRQIIDNNTLVCKPPLMEVMGEVQGNDREFRADQRFIVDNKDSIGQFNIRDISQPTLGVLEYMKEDSNTANSIDKNMIGQSFGSRTSATEAGSIAQSSQRPNMVNIEYVLEQFLGFYAERVKVGWENYGMKEQVIQITDEEDKSVFVRPSEIYGEFDVIIDVVRDIKNDAQEAGQIISYIQTAGSIPQLAQTLDWKGLSEYLGEKMMGTSKFVIGSNEGDVEENARANIERMLTAGEFPFMSETMNLQKHLDMYRSERVRWKGKEDQNPNVEVLDNVIEQIQNRISQPPQQAQAAPTPNTASPGEQARQELSGAMGGV